MKICTAPRREHNFYKIDVFEKSPKKTSILESFSEAKTAKNREKMVLKNVCFFNIDFLTFFCDFFQILARFWEARGRQKIEKKLKKSIFQRVHFLRRVLGGFWEGLGTVLR